MKSPTRLALLALCPLLFTGCDAERDEYELDEPELEDSEHRINGSIWTFEIDEFESGCSPREEGKIRAAMNLVVSEINSGDYLACLSDAVPSGDNGDVVEEILSRLLEDKSTAISCKPEVCGNPLAEGCASLDISSEYIRLQKGLVQSSTFRSLAGVIVHEVMHNKGYDHYGSDGWFEPDDRFRVIQQAEQCIVNERPWGLNRSEAPGDTELARAGGSGGSPFELSCPGDGVVRGMQVDSSTSFVNRLQLNCDTGTSAQTGEWKDSTLEAEADCGEDQVVVGLYGAADAMIGHMGMVCMDEADVKAGLPNSDGTRLLMGGLNEKGHYFNRVCPDGMAMKRLYGRSGARIDQVRVVCEEYPVSARGHNRPLETMGNEVGNSHADHCMGFGAMTGLWGSSGAEVDRLGARCKPTLTKLMNNTPFLDTADDYQSIEAFGGTGGTRFGLGDGGGDQCPKGAALVGLRGRAGARLAQVQGVCAQVEDWATSGSAKLTYTSLRGEPGARTRSEERMCERGEFLVGMETWASKTVHANPTVNGVQPICRDLRSNLAPTHLPPTKG